MDRLGRSRLSRVKLVASLWVVFLALGCSLMPVTELFEGPSVPLRFSATHYPYVHGEIIFSHELHDKVPCEECHGAATTAEEVRQGGLPTMATCFDCHDGDTLSQDCETCHVTNRRLRKPRFHQGHWVRNHREMAHNESYKCSLCHLESGCQQCHSLRKPLSHTIRFNRSTHGRYATHDRRSCATCHETDFCVNCHNIPPPDHTPTFMGPIGHRQVARLKLRSCLTCHQYQNSCAGPGCHSSE